MIWFEGAFGRFSYCRLCNIYMFWVTENIDPLLVLTYLPIYLRCIFCKNEFYQWKFQMFLCIRFRISYFLAIIVFFVTVTGDLECKSTDLFDHGERVIPRNELLQIIRCNELLLIVHYIVLFVTVHYVILLVDRVRLKSIKSKVWHQCIVAVVDWNM